MTEGVCSLFGSAKWTLASLSRYFLEHGHILTLFFYSPTPCLPVCIPHGLSSARLTRLITTKNSCGRQFCNEAGIEIYKTQKTSEVGSFLLLLKRIRPGLKFLLASTGPLHTHFATSHVRQPHGHRGAAHPCQGPGDAENKGRPASLSVSAGLRFQSF